MHNFLMHPRQEFLNFCFKERSISFVIQRVAEYRKETSFIFKAWSMKSEQTYVSRIIMLVMSVRWKISLTGAAKYSYQSIFGEYHKARRQHLRFQALIFGNSMRFF